MVPKLIILGGLPGVGKSTIAKELAMELGAVVLRVDTIEHAIREAGPAGLDIGAMGYVVAYRVAVENLTLGRIVVADTVNPIEITREAWRSVARDSGMPFVEVEVFCSDKSEHRTRVETRSTDILNFRLPSWQEVVEREYEPWKSANLRIDTARVSVKEAVQMIKDF